MQRNLRIQEFEVMLNLGFGEEEQLTRQPVQFTLDLKFLDDVAACVSDQLHDTVDYVELTQIITAVATMKNYHLVEHLSQQVLNDIIVYLKNKGIRAVVKLSVQKMKVPIANLKNGVVFSCETSL